MNNEYEEQEYETNMEAVMAYYAQSFEGMARYEWAWNPITNKVIFKLFCRREPTVETNYIFPGAVEGVPSNTPA